MTRAQALIVARQIDKHLATLAKVERSETGLTLGHLRWMVTQMEADMSTSKTMRWLGYIQGVLVAWQVYALDEMKEMSRVASSENVKLRKPMMWHVTFYYLATGMEGRADTRDWIVQAPDAETAKDRVAKEECRRPGDREFFKGCLTAREVK